ncbi:hypothetical protein CEXT_328381 [Caerostris extrusa]|uniref:Uncharacterized protein n=1 Tax=Caerostris extrusa TaxID=172846 RepID=A0AAV4RZB5_CAEEX|nr:hypothetical protein CEXT_328381 [Caerostris extrusa]
MGGKINTSCLQECIVKNRVLHNEEMESLPHATIVKLDEKYEIQRTLVSIPRLNNPSTQGATQFCVSGDTGMGHLLETPPATLTNWEDFRFLLQAKFLLHLNQKHSLLFLPLNSNKNMYCWNQTGFTFSHVVCFPTQLIIAKSDKKLLFPPANSNVKSM